jgi:hypothetical protein
MLQDLDATLAALLQAELAVHNVAISFAALDDQFPPAGASLPAVAFVLYDVREERDLRSTRWELAESQAADGLSGNGSAPPAMAATAGSPTGTRP